MYMRSIRQRSSEMKTHREERNLSIFIVSLIKRVVVKKQDWTKGCDLTVTSQGGLRRAMCSDSALCPQFSKFLSGTYRVGRWGS